MGKIDYQKIREERRDGWKEATSDGGKKFENLFAGQYSENNHFIYELLQNAEDAGATFITFSYQGSQLIVYHDGRPFDEKDVWAICSVMEGTKDKNDIQTIGHFGFGFKSVFKYTKRPEVYSNSEAFAIENYLLPVELPLGNFPGDCHYEMGGQEQWPFERKIHYTKFVLPFKDTLKSAGIDPREIPRKLSHLEPEILLFLQNIETLTWVDETTGDYGIYRKISENTSGQGRQYLCEKDGSKEDEEEKSSKRFLVYESSFSMQGTDNGEVNACVKIAFQLGEKKAFLPVGDSPIWVFFPTTDESGLKFLIHGTYQTTISREKIVSDSTYNKELLCRTEDLIISALSDLQDQKLFLLQLPS